MKSAEFVDNKNLRKEIGNLNKCGVLFDAEKKPYTIKSVGLKRVDLIELFLKGVESVPEDHEDAKKIPESVIIFYNDIVNGVDPSPEEIAEIRKKKAPKVKKDRGPNFEQRAYDMIKSMAGKTKEEIVAAGLAMYTDLYAKKDPPKTDAVFIAKRNNIYIDIAEKKIKKESTPVEETPVEEAPVKEKKGK